MRAVCFDEFGEPQVMAVREVPSPRCGPGQVLIDVEAASVTPGDWKLRAGLLKEIFPVSLPCIPGRDGAGVVVQAGESVDYARVGDPVCFVADRLRQGSYAERIVRDADSIVPLPPGLSYAQGAALVHAGMCAWIMLMEYAGLRRGQRILVHAGAGAVGGMAVQLARHAGAHVTATCSARNADYVRGLGAHAVVAYDQQDFAAMPGDYDVVLDLVGGDVHTRSRRVLKRGGVLVWLIGQDIGVGERAADADGIRVVQAVVHDDVQALRAVAWLAGQGALKPQISEIMPLDRVVQAHALVQNSRHGRGRIVLDIRGGAQSRPG